jgi:hypothetical protein
MCTFWVSVAVWLLLKFFIPRVAKNYGPAVEARFVERPKVKQPAGVPRAPLSLESLTVWINANRESARGYVFPVLFPLDFAFMFALSGALGFGSVWTASHIEWLSRIPWWIWWVFPSIYFLADFAEDLLLVGFLRGPDRIPQSWFPVLAAATSVKIRFVIAAFVQLGALIALASAMAIL